MYEIARFQRLWSVRTAGSRFHEGEERPPRSTLRPVTPSSVASRREQAGDVSEETLLVGAVVVGERDDVGGQVVESHVAGA